MKKTFLVTVVMFFLAVLLFASGKQDTEDTAVIETGPVDRTHTNAAELTITVPLTESVELNSYYEKFGIESNLEIVNGGRATIVGMPKSLPKAPKKYRIGLAVYFTFDDVGSMILESTKKAAEKMGVELLVNDANQDAMTQQQAIETWILEKVDGVIIYPVDFYGIVPTVVKLNEAGIKVIAGNPIMGGKVDNSMFLANDEIGRVSANFVVNDLRKIYGEVSGKVVYQTLPMFHPNAVTRAAGFLEVLNKYPDIKIIEGTGIQMEEHYATFEDLLLANDDIRAGWGLYSSACIGMANAAKAAGKKEIIIVGVDNDRPIMAGIKRGEITGSVGYNAYVAGYWTTLNMVNLLMGKDVPGITEWPITVLDRDNVDKLYPEFYGGDSLEEYMSGKN